MIKNALLVGQIVFGILFVLSVLQLAWALWVTRGGRGESMPSPDMPVGEIWPAEGDLADDGPIELWPGYLHPIERREHNADGP